MLSAMLLVCCRTMKMMVISHAACAADNIHMSIFVVCIMHLCVIMTVTATIRTTQMTSKHSNFIMLALGVTGIVWPD